MLAYRYTVASKSEVNVFKPKALAPTVSTSSLRHAEAGACMLGKLGLDTLPDKNHSRVTWDVVTLDMFQPRLHNRLSIAHRQLTEATHEWNVGDTRGTAPRTQG